MRTEVETSVNLFLACVDVEYVLLFLFEVQLYYGKVSKNAIMKILDYITILYGISVHFNGFYIFYC